MAKMKEVCPQGYLGGLFGRDHKQGCLGRLGNVGGFSSALISQVIKNWGVGKMWGLRELIMRKKDHWECGGGEGCGAERAQGSFKLGRIPLSRPSHNCSHNSLVKISSKNILIPKSQTQLKTIS